MSQQVALNHLLQTIQQFQKNIDQQLRPLGLDYLHVLTLLSIKQQRIPNVREHQHLQSLISQQLLSADLQLTDQGEHILQQALEKLRQYEQRLFSAQTAQNSLLSQLEARFQLKQPLN